MNCEEKLTIGPLERPHLPVANILQQREESWGLGLDGQGWTGDNLPEPRAWVSDSGSQLSLPCGPDQILLLRVLYCPSFSLFRRHLVGLSRGIFSFFFKLLALAVKKWLSRFSISWWPASSLRELTLSAQTGLEDKSSFRKSFLPLLSIQKKHKADTSISAFFKMGLLLSWWGSRLIPMWAKKAEISLIPTLRAQCSSHARCCKMFDRGYLDGGIIMMTPFSAYWLSAYSVPGTMLTSSGTSAHLLLKMILWGECCKFLDKELEVRKGEGTCPWQRDS